MRHLTLSLFILLVVSCGRYQAPDDYQPNALEPSPNQLSQDILEGLRAKQDVTALVDQLAAYEPGRLNAALNTREKKLAFWVNTYNGMVQYLLTDKPELYDDRSSFFKTPSFTIAGHELSPNELEHSIIRGGENRFGLGFIPQLFPGKFARTFKVKGGDARVHFALNCGASDCPPVEIYQPDTYNDQIDARAKSYLSDHSEIKEIDGEQVIVTSPLFSWFKGDFREYDGVDDFLVKYGPLNEENKNMKREYEEYDWTLETGIWAK